MAVRDRCQLPRDDVAVRGRVAEAIPLWGRELVVHPMSLFPTRSWNECLGDASRCNAAFFRVLFRVYQSKKI